MSYDPASLPTSKHILGQHSKDIKAKFWSLWQFNCFWSEMSSQDCLKGESRGFFKVEILIWNGYGSKLWIQMASNLRKILGTQCSWYLKRFPNIALLIVKEIRFIRYIEMKISKEKWKTLKETLQRVLWRIFGYCCRSEDSSTFTANFETKYFCKK